MSLDAGDRGPSPASPTDASRPGLAGRAVKALWGARSVPATVRAALRPVVPGKFSSGLVELPPGESRRTTLRMNKALRRTLVGVALGVLLYVGAAVWFGVDELRRALTSMDPRGFGGGRRVVWGLRLRFAKWELALRWLEVRSLPLHTPLTRRNSAVIFLAGMSMSVTPGKLGEVVRSGLLSSNHGVPFARTAPFVLADRAADVFALVLLCLLGLGRVDGLGVYVAAAGALTGLGVLVLAARRRPRRPGGRRADPRTGNLTPRLEALLRSARVLTTASRMTTFTALSLLAWGLECLGYAAVIWAATGTWPELFTCALLWSATTLIGAVSMLPGGLGATEGSLAALAPRMIPGLVAETAMATTLVIRGATLWFAEVIGPRALALPRARLGELPDCRPRGPLPGIGA